MKKFLSKMPVMIVFLSLAAVGLVFYIVMLARPVSYGMTYSIIQTVETEEDATESGLPIGTEAGMKIKFKNDKKATLTVIIGESEIKTECWVYRMGYKVAMLGATSDITEEEYNQAVETLKADKETFNNLAVEINAFKMGNQTDEEDATCNGAIVFAVVCGVVEVALILFAVLSTLYFVKGKKSGSTPSETTETTTDTQIAA